MKNFTLLLLVFISSFGYAQVNLPIDFESTTVTYTFTDFDGGQMEVIDNPDMTGINTSGKVARMIKNDGQPWGGSLIELDAPIDFSTNQHFKMKVWSPDAGRSVLLKAENLANGGIFYEQSQTTTVGGAWEELTFDFTGVNTAESYQKLVFIFDLGTVGDGSANFTFYVDDIEQFDGGGGTGSGITLPIDFESTTVTYTFTDFDGGQMEVIDNPDMSGINTSDKVARMIKNDGQPWGGSLIELDAPIDFSTNQHFKMKVWSPDAGRSVLLKAENLTNGAIFYEQSQTTTVGGAWEELTFDFSGVNTAESYQKLVLIFDNGTVGDGSANFTFYVDDIEQFDGGGGTGSGITLPIDFESMTIDYTFSDFSGGQMEVIDNPDMTGINTSDKVARMIKNDGDPWGGSLIELDAPIDFSTNKHFRMKVWTPGAGRKVLLKAENPTNGAIFYEQEQTTTVGDAWEEMTFDFTGINTAETYQKLVFIFDLGTVGDGSANFTFYLDDIEQFDGGTGLDQVDLPITFEETATVDYALVDFGGNASAIVEDPTDPTNMVGQAIKTDMAELWAGTTNGGNGLATPIPFTADDTKMSVRVWSPDAGTPIRLKVEDATDPEISVETEAVTTMAGQWETLEFDFSNEAMGTAALDLANTYNKVSIFFNFGTDGATAGEKTYYWDDIQFGGIVGSTGEPASAGGINIFPNPARDFFTIEFSEALKGAVQVSIFDANGKLVRNVKVSGQRELVEVGDLNAGVYYFNIQKDAANYHYRLVKI